MSRKIKVFLIVLVVLLIAIGGFFYWWENWQPWKTEGNPPTLFNKDDYKIVEKNGEKFIEVKKVGLTAKVPSEWKIEFEGNNIPQPEYWIELYSLDFETSTGNTLTKGCVISFVNQIAEKTNKELKENIDLLKTNYQEGINILKENYILAENFEIIKFKNFDALKVTSQENKIMGGGEYITIPFNKKIVSTIGIGFPLDYKNNCLTIWEEFIKNIEIK